MNTKQLIDNAVSLPVEDRALVLDSLLRSLNQPETEMDKKWAKTAKRRLAEHRTGHAAAVSKNEFFFPCKTTISAKKWNSNFHFWKNYHLNQKK